MREPMPELPDEVDAGDLDTEVRRALLGMPKVMADLVARHLVATGALLDSDPERALLHARFARRKAARVGVVREAAGLAAYHAGEWNEALVELRAARRLAGGPGHVAVMADCERALGRPERALDLARTPEARQLPADQAVELRIVVAGARRDMGQLDAAVVELQGTDLDPARVQPWSARLFYAYADNLLAAGRQEEALRWFVNAAQADSEDETDADDRAVELASELGRTVEGTPLPRSTSREARQAGGTSPRSSERPGPADGTSSGEPGTGRAVDDPAEAGAPAGAGEEETTGTGAGGAGPSDQAPSPSAEVPPATSLDGRDDPGEAEAGHRPNQED
ncbi:hypothetical protein [Actinoalloteichus spitiensis]|uniref:hypothetical protein n=1 Tax=Actinoalloteichus spitiensis TaxID=252394 RepID=UPI0012F641D8|nr:hypothetical protein [Actinoalloteichus spitiensis]